MIHGINEGAAAWMETPEDMQYQLAMFDAGVSRQFIELTRGEYNALKQHLARLRHPGKAKAVKPPPPNVVTMPIAGV